MTRQQQHDDVFPYPRKGSPLDLFTVLSQNNGRLYGMDTTTEGGHLLCIYMAHYRYYNDTPLDGEVLLVSDALTSHHKSLSRRPPCKIVVSITPAAYGIKLTRSLRVSESAFSSPMTNSSTVETNSDSFTNIGHACLLWPTLARLCSRAHRS